MWKIATESIIDTSAASERSQPQPRPEAKPALDYSGPVMRSEPDDELSQLIDKVLLHDQKDVQLPTSRNGSGQQGLVD